MRPSETLGDQVRGSEIQWDPLRRAPPSPSLSTGSSCPALLALWMYPHVYIYIYVYICVRVCSPYVCTSQRENGIWPHVAAVGFCRARQGQDPRSQWLQLYQTTNKPFCEQIKWNQDTDATLEVIKHKSNTNSNTIRLEHMQNHSESNWIHHGNTEMRVRCGFAAPTPLFKCEGICWFMLAFFWSTLNIFKYSICILFGFTYILFLWFPGLAPVP